MHTMMNRILITSVPAVAAAAGLLVAPSLRAQDTGAPAQLSPPAQQQPAFGQAPFNPGRLAPNYPVPYGPTTVEQITKVLNRVREYLETNTPTRVVNRQTGAEITDFSKSDPDAVVERGAFQIISYEWGVTYSGMLLAAEATSDQRFKDYVAKRMQFIADRVPYFRAQASAAPQQGQGRGGGGSSFRSVIRPATLDDSGAMCAAMIKAHRAGVVGDLRPLIDNYINWISTGQFRLPDGTLARNRPFPNSLWLDDLYMSVPALAQMGKLAGDRKYYDDAVKQITQFAQRMFNKEKGLYMHGWVAGMDAHPEFRWARANGWAIMAKTELLEVLPEEHPGRQAVLDLLRAHIRGLADCQDRTGLWHQLLDRNDSYLETSASAMFVYCIAHAIDRGWINPLAYGPVAQLGWNAVTTKVNALGQVEDTCVGTGMAFDPAFYYYRPASVYAAHGYGPVLLAGAEMINLAKNGRSVIISNNAVQFEPALANQ